MKNIVCNLEEFRKNKKLRSRHRRTEQDIKDYLLDCGFENTVIYSNPSYADAFIGVTTNGIAIYDYDKMVECLMKDENMTEDEAIDWVEYNIAGCLGDEYPIVINTMPREEQKEENTPNQVKIA